MVPSFLKNMFYSSFGWVFIYRGVRFYFTRGDFLDGVDISGIRFVRDVGDGWSLFTGYDVFGGVVREVLGVISDSWVDIYAYLVELEGGVSGGGWFVSYLDWDDVLVNEVVSVHPVDLWKLDKSKKILFFYKL